METTSSYSMAKDHNQMLLNQAELVDGAIKHIQFLRKLHAKGVTLQEPSAQSIHRYLNLWLPLVAEDQDAVTIPPPDIAWIWHCHRLAPLRYEEYTLKRFGAVVESSAPFEFQEEGDDDSKNVRATRKMWESKYPDEPFYLNESSTAPVCGTWQLDADGIDLVGSTSRQKMFLWHVSQPRFKDYEFLQDGVLNYQRFLMIKHQHGKESTIMPRLVLVPTIKIDLMWHTHIALSVTQYNRDCIAIRGEKFHHDDSMDDRPGAFLDRCFQETCRLWEKEYGESYSVPGGMYRGTPPSDFLDPSWDWKAFRTAQEVSVMVADFDWSGTTNIGDKVETMEKMTSQPDGSIQKGTAKTVHNPDDINAVTNTKKVDRSSASPSTRSNTSSTATDLGDDKTPWKPAAFSAGTIIVLRSAFPSEISKKPSIGFKGYVFGSGTKGAAFYSLETKDAYDILYRDRKKQHAKQMSNLICYKCCCCFSSSAVYDKQLKKKQDDLVQTANMLAYLKARKEAIGPRSALNDDTVKQYRAKELQQHVDHDMYPYVPFYWVNTTSYAAVTAKGGGQLDGVDCYTNSTSNACGAAGCGGRTSSGDGWGAGGGAACAGGGGGGAACGGGSAGAEVANYYYPTSAAGGGGACGGGGVGDYPTTTAGGGVVAGVEVANHHYHTSAAGGGGGGGAACGGGGGGCGGGGGGGGCGGG